MNTTLQPDRAVPDNVRARIAAELSRYYAELSGLQVDAPAFSITRLLLSHAKHKPLLDCPHELSIVKSAALMLGQEVDSHRNWVPLAALRTMGAAGGSKGGYLVGGDVAEPVDLLRPYSVVASSGATLLYGLREDLLIPRTTGAPAVTWIGETNAGPSESPPALGNVSMVPKTAVALVKFSTQLLKQGPAVEPYIRALLLATAGEAIDTAFFSGPGGVAPIGLLQTPGIGSQSGGSLAHAGTLAMRKAVLNAGGREEALQWVGTPAVQETLAARRRFADGDRAMWDDTGILGRPGYATKNAPANALVTGDFAKAVVGIWGSGIRIDIDPSQDFNSAGLVARVMVLCDVAFPRPDAFCVATSVS